MATTGVVLVVELYGAYISGSLGLLSDAGHMLTDLSGLLLAYLALVWASRPASPHATYGYHRAEVLAAGVNGFLIAGVAVFIIIRAVDRLVDPVERIDARVIIAAASVGLIANLVAAWLLHDASKGNINARGAFLNVVGDAVASVGVILSGVMVWWTGQTIWDTVVSFAVAAIIAYSALRLLGSTTAILLEVSPRGIDPADVKARLETVDGVVNVHDLHIWTLTPGHDSASLHATIRRDMVPRFHEVIQRMEEALAEHFGLDHCTIQVEPEGHDLVSDRYDPVHQELK